MKTKWTIQQITASFWFIFGAGLFLAYFLGLDVDVKQGILGVYFVLFGLYLLQEWQSATRMAHDGMLLHELRNKTDMLLKHAGLTYDAKEHLPAGVLEALAKGDKITAIKCYRQSTGVGLREAKLAVEELQMKP